MRKAKQLTVMMADVLATSGPAITMNVLIENGTYGLWNLGDAAMLRVAAARIEEMTPGITIGIVTEAGERFEKLMTGLKGVEPMPPGDWNAVYARRRVTRGAKRMVRSIVGRVTQPKDAAVEKWVRACGVGTGSTRAFIKRMLEADAVIAAGGGYITDH